MERVIMMNRFFSFPCIARRGVSPEFPSIPACGGGSGWGQAGQAYTEYGLILVLVGITVIGALTIMGLQVGGMWHTISASIPH
jgi:Flp pilus assembly pilin Flp